MDDKQAGNIVTRMSSVLLNHPFDSDLAEIALTEWNKQLLKLEADQGNKTVDVIITRTKFFPSIADFLEAYKSFNRNKTRIYKDCEICKGDGGLVHNKNAERPNLFSHCICEKGLECQYEGNEYFFNSILVYFTTLELEVLKYISIVEFENIPGGISPDDIEELKIKSIFKEKVDSEKVKEYVLAGKKIMIQEVAV